MAFHYLTAHDKPSMDTNTLPRLGPKFCIQPRGFQTSNTIRMIDSLKRNERLKDYLMSNSFDKDDENPSSYRKNEKRQPPNAIGPTDDNLNKVKTSMHLETSKRTYLKISNLTKLQHNGLNLLRNSKQYVILIADKNIGL